MIHVTLSKEVQCIQGAVIMGKLGMVLRLEQPLMGTLKIRTTNGTVHNRPKERSTHERIKIKSKQTLKSRQNQFSYSLGLITNHHENITFSLYKLLSMLYLWASFHFWIWVLLVCKLSFWWVHSKFLAITTSVIHWFYLLWLLPF